MECGKLTAKLRDAVPVCFMVDGKEVKRYKNIEIPDEIKKLPYKAFDFNVPLTGAITFKISFEPGILPEVWPEKRQRKSRAAKEAKAEILANVTDALQHALEQAEADGQPVQDVAEAAINGAEVRAEAMGRRSSSRQRMARKQRKVQSRKKRRRNTQWRCTTM